MVCNAPTPRERQQRETLIQCMLHGKVPAIILGASGNASIVAVDRHTVKAIKKAKAKT